MQKAAVLIRTWCPLRVCVCVCVCVHNEYIIIYMRKLGSVYICIYTDAINTN